MLPYLHRAPLTLLALAVSACPLPALQQVSGQRIPLQNPCADSVRDQAGGACLQASSVPALGALYPLSSDLFVDPATGWLGVGTAFPLARLSILGDANVHGGLSFNAKNHGIQFSSANFLYPQVPMLTMFDGGTANPDRMVLAHTPNFPDWGLMYRDAGDEFVFQRGPSAPVMTINLPQGRVDLEGHLDAESVALDSDSPIMLSVENSSQALTNVLLLKGTNQPTGLPISSYDFVDCRWAIGTYGSVFRISSYGSVYADGSYTGPADFAEMIRVGTGAESVEAGDLLVIDPKSDRSVVRSSAPRSRLVIGVYSTEPGFVGSERDWEDGETSLDRSDMALTYDEVPVAVVGIVPVKASAENGPIRRGDLLVSSSTPGHVMRDDDPRAGTVVGKALGELEDQHGRIRMLVSLQ
jgi:hypothetical protein